MNHCNHIVPEWKEQMQNQSTKNKSVSTFFTNDDEFSNISENKMSRNH